MGTAQDLALLALARSQGVLGEPPERAEGDDTPLAQVLLERQIPSEVVASMLRDLAQGHFVCELCAERLPYAFLSTLSELRCPRCQGDLQHFPNPRARRPIMEDTTVRLSPAEETMRPAYAGRAAYTPLPRRFGKLLLTRELGRGANGVVYEARAQGERPLALKVLHPGAADPEGLLRLRQEAVTTQRVEHPGVVRVHHVGCHEGQFFCLMELVEGETLRHLLARRGLLRPVEAARFITAVADVVGAAHAAQVVHRDLKPANVLLDRRRRGAPRVTDFGLAHDQRLTGQLTVTGQMLGTPVYMAPEQFLGHKVDARTDVYALGVLLYECLTGRLPHQAPTIVALASRVLGQDPAPPSRFVRLPQGLELIVGRCLARPPRARFSDASELAAALRELTRPR